MRHPSCAVVANKGIWLCLDAKLSVLLSRLSVCVDRFGLAPARPISSVRCDTQMATLQQVYRFVTGSNVLVACYDYQSMSVGNCLTCPCRSAHLCQQHAVRVSCPAYVPHSAVCLLRHAAVLYCSRGAGCVGAAQRTQPILWVQRQSQ
jgi:hypothetical protein